MLKSMKACTRMLCYLIVIASLWRSDNASAADFRAGLQVEDIAYKEPYVMEEKGLLAGVFLQADIAAFKEVQLSCYGAYVFGDLDYKSASSARTQLASSNPNSIIDLRLDASVGLTSLRLPVKVYSGAGYRQLSDDLQDIGELEGYTRVQEYFYLPIGLQIFLPSPLNWKITGIAEYDLFLKGYNSSRLFDVTQSSGYGYRASILIGRILNGCPVSEILLEPFIQYWDIDKSSIDRNFYEPENSSSMMGLRLSVLF